MNTSQMIKEIKKGHNIESNLPLYGRSLMESYDMQSHCKLVLNYVSNHEFLSCYKGLDEELVLEGIQLLSALIDRVVIRQDVSNLEGDINTLDALRKRLVAQSGELNKYVNFLQVYEQLCHVARFRFQEILPALPSDKELVQQLMGYVQRGKDPIEVNGRMKELLGELPVRLTKQKFLDMLDLSCMCYIGARTDMVENFFEHLDECAQMLNFQALSPKYEALYALAQGLMDTDFNTLDLEGFEELYQEMEEATQELTQGFSSTLGLLELINDMYVILIARPFVLREDKAIDTARTILKAYADNQVDKESSVAQQMKNIQKLSERQELLVGNHMLMEDQLTLISKAHMKEIEAMMLKPLFNGLYRNLSLTGLNIFADIQEDISYKNADKDYIKGKIQALKTTFETAFAQHKSALNRVVMALTFDRLPVAFNTMGEMEQYVENSLALCRDPFEKAAAIEGLMEIIEEES